MAASNSHAFKYACCVFNISLPLRSHDFGLTYHFAQAFTFHTHVLPEQLSASSYVAADHVQQTETIGEGLHVIVVAVQ